MKTYRVEKPILVVREKPHPKTGELEKYHERINKGAYVQLSASDAKTYGDKLVAEEPPADTEVSKLDAGTAAGAGEAPLRTTKAAPKGE